MTLPSIVVLACTGLACRERERQDDEFRYFVPSHVETIDPRAIALTEEVFGVEMVEVASPWGAVSIFPLARDAFEGAPDGEFDKGGQAFVGRCTSWVWYLADDPAILAHELGHAYHLGHASGDCNIMTQSFSCANEELMATPQQKRAVREESWRQRYACDALSPSP